MLAVPGGGNKRMEASGLKTLTDAPTVYLAAQSTRSSAGTNVLRAGDAPTVYLAHQADKRTPGENNLLAAESPTMYWASSPGTREAERQALSRDPMQASGPKEAPDVYLAHSPGAQGDNVLVGEATHGRRGQRLIPRHLAPALLLSYVYVRKFLEEQARYRYRCWAMDSGGFTAWKSGETIDLVAYTDLCQQLFETDQTLVEVMALDVVGSWRQSVRNFEYMWSRKVPALPIYHYGEPLELLRDLRAAFPYKIAIGGMAGLFSGKKKLAQLAQILEHCWPCRVHGLGVGSRSAVMALPFHSVDASNWEIGPCKFGNWRSFGKGVSVRGSNHDLRVEIEYYLRVEREARARWRREMARLEAEQPPWPLRRLQ